MSRLLLSQVQRLCQISKIKTNKYMSNITTIIVAYGIDYHYSLTILCCNFYTCTCIHFFICKLICTNNVYDQIPSGPADFPHSKLSTI